MDDELQPEDLMGGWYEYEPRGHHKHQIWKQRYLVVSWANHDTMWSDLDELGLTIDEGSNIKRKE